MLRISGESFDNGDLSRGVSGLATEVSARVGGMSALLWSC